MKIKIKITEIEMTCGGCPTQWSGKVEGADGIYIWYRWGCLSVSLIYYCQGKDGCDDYREIFSEEVGGPMDGVMSYEQLKDYTSHFLQFPDGFGD